MTAQAYLITFTPVDRFFFGSSRSFSEDFYVESMRYPQPTTVMGCLRHTLLMQNGFEVYNSKGLFSLKTDDTEIQNLTGTCKMKALTDDDCNFGIIEKISPPFIVHKDKSQEVKDILFPIPGDVQINDGEFIKTTYEKIHKNARSCYTSHRRDYVIKSKKDPKIDHVPYLGGEQFWRYYCENKTPLPFNENLKEASIIIENKSVGIGRQDRRTQPGMFYAKRDLSLKKSFSFGILAWLTEGDKLRKGTVVLGGERSVFQLEIKKIEKSGIFKTHPLMNALLNNNTDFVSLMENADSESKIITLSPVLVSISMYETLEHGIISSIVTMRMLKPQCDNKSHNGKKSDSVCMIPGCSVLYPSGAYKTKEQYKIPYKIGYNYAIKIAQ